MSTRKKFIIEIIIKSKVLLEKLKFLIICSVD